MRAIIVCAMAGVAIAAAAITASAEEPLSAGDSTVAGAAASKDSTSEERRVQRGLAIAPVELDFSGKDRTLIGLGSYLVNAAGGCNDCHTNPPFAEGGNPFEGEPKVINAAGYLGGGTPFGPGLVSRNLTPDPVNGRPAGLTFGQFLRAIRTGEDADAPGRLLQVMPWPVYQSLTYRDVRAIYEYLRAIPTVERAPD
jgi:hypothetical protein